MNFSSSSPRSILVIGAGYIGSKLHALLRDKGHRVFLSDVGGQDSETTFKTDITREEDVKRLAGGFAGDCPDVVVLCASAGGGGQDACRALYLDGTVHVCRHFPQSRILLCSSTALYGVGDGRWVTETHTLNPLTPEAALLVKAEQAVRDAGGIVARISAIYGPGRCVLLERLLEKHQAIAGDAGRWLNYVHRDDVVSALALLAVGDGLEGRTFNISDTCPMQIEDIYRHLCGLLELAMPQFHPALPGSRRGGTSQRISSSLLLSCGWVPLYPCFVDGVYNVLEEMGTPY